MHLSMLLFLSWCSGCLLGDVLRTDSLDSVLYWAHGIRSIAKMESKALQRKWAVLSQL